ncbi:MAG: hypothetical protein M3R59_10930, partial [Verrucomicrobiota bacterium]|nr:hypothetical protein [Verrucomicrobiota bacterium]
TAHPGTTIRYSSYQSLGNFQRSTWSATNNFISRAFIPLNVISGGTLYGTGSVAFLTPYVINPIAPTRMLIGTTAIYESTNQGDSLTRLAYIPGGLHATALAYGSRLNGVAKPDVFYVGSVDSNIEHRVNVADAVSTITYPGSGVFAMAMDPQNYQKLYVVDNQFPSRRVWASFNEGVSWVNITANLSTLCGDIRTIEVFSPDAGIKNTVLIAGGAGGIFQMRRPGSAGSSWTSLSSGLPHALFRDLHYDYTDNVLVAGALGRGAWTLTNFFRGGGGTGVDVTASTPLPAQPRNGGRRIRKMPWQPPVPMREPGSETNEAPAAPAKEVRPVMLRIHDLMTPCDW